MKRGMGGWGWERATPCPRICLCSGQTMHVTRREDRQSEEFSREINPWTTVFLILCERIVFEGEKERERKRTLSNRD